MMSEYSAQDFANWYESIHGYSPYPWQARLVETILNGQASGMDNAAWPEVLDLPTGSGKTTAIDIAIYTQAADPKNAPRRIVYVVDRRAIVSQTTEHVRKLQHALLVPQGPVQQRVTEALRSRMAHSSPNCPPLLVAELRGGIPLDNEWASEPDIPAVLISTVDQVGSRLLFRGYGVSPRMRPVHAGLLGNDCLWLLDEVHLSKPFAKTLKELQSMAELTIKGGLPVRNGVVQMSATPVDKSAEPPFTLTEEDLEASPRLKERVQSVKYAQLKKLTLAGAKRPEDVHIAKIPAVAKKVKGNVIGVIVNRVETAVKVARNIKESEPEAEVITLTGRMRPIDREVVWEQVARYSRAGRDRSKDSGRVYIVSTQTIEAGADLDFDGMVTELASMDALVQRAGRVDRRGECWASGDPAEIVIVASSSQIGSKYVDPVYGDTLLKTWNLLEGLHGEEPFDMGPASEQLGTPEERRECSAPSVSTTRLASHHLDALCQTFPEPGTQPEVAYHLHGVQETREEVSVIWRGEVPLTWASAQGGVAPSAHEQGVLIEQLLLCPPRNTEAIGLPLPAFMRWAQSQTHQARTTFEKPPVNSIDVADVDRYVPKNDDEQIQAASIRVLRWAGAESELIPLSEVRNGDTLVVPRAWGGISEGNWDSEATEPVEDLGDIAQFKRALDYRGEAPTIRLSQWFGWPNGGYTPASSDSDSGSITKKQLRDRLVDIKAYIQTLSQKVSVLSPLQLELLEAFDPTTLVVSERVGGDKYEHETDLRRPVGDTDPARSYYAVIGKPLPEFKQTAKEFIFETDGSDEASSLVGNQLSLDTHCDDVASAAAAYADSLGVHAYKDALKLAGSFHDLGKADPRFQTILHGGDVVAAAGSNQLLAKSKESPRNGAQALAIIEQSGYPRGTRHELLSLALLESLDTNALDDFDLIKHLVATHHGMCRALPPRQDQSKSIRVKVIREGFDLEANTAHGLDDIGSGITQRFWQMTDRFGWYGLAWLEAILRLADHHESARRAAQAQLNKDNGHE